MDEPTHSAERASVIPVVVISVALVCLLALYLASRNKSEPPPKSSDHWRAVRKARSLLKQGRPDLALEAVSGIRDEAPGAGEAMTVAGMALIHFNELKSARQAFERGLKLQPRQPNAAKVLAAIYLNSGDAARGVRWLKEAAKLNPRDPQPWVGMGRVHHDLGEIETSAEDYREAVRRDPGNLDARVSLVAELVELNRHEEATADVVLCLAKRPTDPKLLGLSARWARGLGRNDEALEFAERALKLDPDSGDALFTRAQIRRLSGALEPAIADLERAVAANPNDLSSLQALSQTLAQAGKSAESARASERHRLAKDRAILMDKLTREIEGKPDDPAPRHELGRVALEGNLRELAIKCFQAALDLDPNHEPSKSALAKLSDAPIPSLSSRISTGDPTD